MKTPEEFIIERYGESWLKSEWTPSDTMDAMQEYRDELLSTAIHAKALRKKGTEEWYGWDSNAGWRIVERPQCYPINRSFITRPPNAVLVDIVIVTPKNE